MLLQNKSGQTLPFSIKLFKETYGVEYISSLSFSEEEIKKQAIFQANRRLEKEALKKMNRWSLAMFHQEYQKGPIHDLIISYIHPLIGFGVYALSTIAENSFIGEYTGVVRERHRRKDRLNDYVFGYVIGKYDTPWVIDAKDQGNFTRFFNHSLQPNLTSKCMIIDGISHIIFFSNRKIEKGEQLTYDYGPYYWKGRSLPITI
ncbi:MAG: SET domain-containing protein [Chlamydiae bacterium]|nr:SET domain-containing protein [Chlamydiota bacterium]